MTRGTTLAILTLSGLAAADPTLEGLVEDALSSRAELAQAAAQVRAARERVPQAEAWPDPMLQLGVQNESFTKWNVGVSPMNFISFMASQTFPFPGKTGLRGELAQTEVQLRTLATERLRLSTIAQVRRAYLGLQLLEEQEALLDRLLALNTRLVEVAVIRSQTGASTQAEVLRARVELARVRQRKDLLHSQQQLRVHDLNRLRAKPLETEIHLATRLTALPWPALLDAEPLRALEQEHCPELLAARVASTRARSAKSLAERAYLPDLSVSAGVMVRGPLEPMWAVNVGLPIPVFAAVKQSRAVAEASAEGDAAQHGLETIDQQLALRARHRVHELATLHAVWRSYQEGLLQQADAAAQSTLASYATGQESFSAVLESNAVSIAETDASLQVLADAWRLVIAQDELSPTEGGM